MPRAILLLGLPVLLLGCSSQQLYGAGQGWQRDNCQKLQDAQERSRCTAQADKPYDQYQRESDAAKSTY